jgi:uncharacterized protein YndB with AHSA1/START domain
MMLHIGDASNGGRRMSVETAAGQEQQTTDRIEKRIELRASQSRVWRAIASAEEFGSWFRMAIDGEFVEGATVRGKVLYPGYEHIRVDMQVERVEPERYFAYRWHPYPMDPAVDYSAEPTTLVEFELEEVDSGTVVTIRESGFDRIPLARRAEAFRMNEQGWAAQSLNLERYVA